MCKIKAIYFAAIVAKDLVKRKKIKSHLERFEDRQFGEHFTNFFNEILIWLESIAQQVADMRFEYQDMKKNKIY